MQSEVCERCRPAFEKLEKKVAELTKYVQVLETKLAQFTNPHTPPSIARTYRKCQNDDEKPKGIPGRKPGFEGTTRRQPEPQRRIIALAQKCSNCDAPLPSPTSFERRVIEEIPEPQPILVTEFMLAHYECSNCGSETVAEHPECPATGMFGPNILALAALMKHQWRLPYRMACDMLQTIYGLTITPATMLDIGRRVSDALEPEYEEIRENIRAASVVYGDETGAPMNGDKWWDWSFSTPTDVLFAIRDSRGSDVPDEVLGDEFDGAMVNDGWKPYGEYANKHGLQMGRCWAHILREADDLAEKTSAAEIIANRLHENLNELKAEVKKNPSMKVRKRLYSNGLRRLRRLTKKCFRRPDVKKLLEKLERARHGLMTFVLVPGMEPTNNRAERNLREQVIQRKISRTFRSAKGIRINEVLMSALATWQARGWNCYAELLKRLT